MAFGEDCTAIGGIERTNNFEQLKQTHCSGKLMMLERLLNQWAATKDKALVFSQSTAMLDIIQAVGLVVERQTEKLIDAIVFDRSGMSLYAIGWKYQWTRTTETRG